MDFFIVDKFSWYYTNSVFLQLLFQNGVTTRFFLSAGQKKATVAVTEEAETIV